MSLWMKSKVFIELLQTAIKKDGKDTAKFVAKYSNVSIREIKLRRNNNLIGIEKFYNFCEIQKIVDKEISEALSFLIENGYVKKFTKPGFREDMTYTFYGITNKGWEVADKYLKL